MEILHLPGILHVGNLVDLRVIRICRVGSVFKAFGRVKLRRSTQHYLAKSDVPNQVLDLRSNFLR